MSVCSDFRVRSMVEPGHGRRTVRSTSKLSIVIERNESLSDEAFVVTIRDGVDDTRRVFAAIAARAPGDRGRSLGPRGPVTGSAPAMIIVPPGPATPLPRGNSA